MGGSPPTGEERDLPAPLQRRRAAAIAGHCGDIDTARAFLDDPDPYVRATALGALERAGGLTAEALATALTDPAAVVRARAAELVPSLVKRAAGDATQPELSHLSLLPLLHDPDPAVVETAAFACGERMPPEPGTVAHLAAIAREHNDPLCREAAVAALGAIGDPAGLPAILDGTRDKPAIRRRAVLALAPFDGPEVDEALQRALSDRDWQVRQAAEDLLGPT